MLAVLAKHWLSNGWNSQDPDDAEAMALAFIEQLDLEGIPSSAYMELYFRARVRMREERAAGKSRSPGFPVDLLIECWPAVRDAINELAPKQLSVSAPTQCLRCYGTGMEQVYDDEGRKQGVRAGCKHEHLDTSDPHSAGMGQAMAALASQEETAADICRRVRRGLTQDFQRAETDAERYAAFRASGTWLRAERYCEAQEMML